MDWFWTWGGECFGYRDGDSLFTYFGKDVGRFDGEEIYGSDGRYLGEVMSDNRLITTADGVLIHIDTNQAGEKLVNTRLAYVAVSRGRYDAQIYTNDALDLGEALSRDTSKISAVKFENKHSMENIQQLDNRQTRGTNSPASQQSSQQQGASQSAR